MKIYFERENKTIEKRLIKTVTLKELLNKLNISNESVILVKNNNIVLEDETITDEDEVKLLSVISGG